MEGSAKTRLCSGAGRGLSPRRWRARVGGVARVDDVRAGDQGTITAAARRSAANPAHRPRRRGDAARASDASERTRRSARANASERERARRYARAKHESERAGWELAGPRAAGCRDEAIAALTRERDELTAEIDRHYAACVAEVEASFDDAAADAGSLAVLADLDRQTRLVDDVAGALDAAIKHADASKLAEVAPKLLRRCDDALHASHRLSDKAASAPALAVQGALPREGVADRLRASLGAASSRADGLGVASSRSARGAASLSVSSSSADRGAAAAPAPTEPDERLAQRLAALDRVLTSSAQREPDPAYASWTPRGDAAASVEQLLASLRDEVSTLSSRVGDRPPFESVNADAAIEAADRALGGAADATNPSTPAKTPVRRGAERGLDLSGDRYDDILESSLRRVEASAKRSSSRRRGVGD